MFDQIFNRLPQLKERLQYYASLAERLEVPAKTILLREGEVSRRSFFVEKGCLRVWFNKNGLDVTSQFMFEKQIVSSVDSFRHNIPSAFTIEAIEPSVVHALHKRDYDAMMEELGQDNSFLRMMLEIISDRQLHYMKECMSFIRDTPQERYLNLLKEKPHIAQRVPQRYIASYLGITPVHLSRIRNKIARENS